MCKQTEPRTKIRNAHKTWKGDKLSASIKSRKVKLKVKHA